MYFSHHTKRRKSQSNVWILNKDATSTSSEARPQPEGKCHFGKYKAEVVNVILSISCFYVRITHNSRPLPPPSPAITKKNQLYFLNGYLLLDRITVDALVLKM